MTDEDSVSTPNSRGCLCFGDIPVGSDASRIIGETRINGPAVTDVVLSSEIERKEGNSFQESSKRQNAASGFSEKLGGSSSRGMMELRAIACVEAQLGQPLRDDGPILGMEFDPLRPDAFEAIPELHKRSGQPYESKLYDRDTSKASVSAIHEYQFLPDHSSLRSDACGQVTHSHFYESPVNGIRGGATLFVHGEEPLSRVHGIQGQGSQVPLLPQQRNMGIISSSSKVSDDPQNNKKRKSDENRIAREVEAQDDGNCKDLEKLDNKRRKNEERTRKEVERHERERRKEEERLMRKKQREEERLQREKQWEEERLQREKQREEERRKKILQKEYVRAEKKRQKEELQREKEEERRRVAREKTTARKISKESMGFSKMNS
ncbi:hypothetical protein F3Y22_tig00110187pilonHSYRG00357 [Hibiscus syriacus]|uniref:Uncharacterized protein n=1 Tax=Hibiscus syriacus TaxID=106335 RepID=A0A6A3BFX2_HIBSY|nr:hypothetical protein F3Y22_tig00110187pilonHSYRG00357 [Hibiscus syriacus]